MITHGSLSNEKPRTQWSKADFDAYLTMASIGVLAGLAVSFIRTPLHMPGHKVLLWMAPAIAGRMATRARAAASMSVLMTIATTLILGGQLGGGFIMMPLALFAGVTLDAAGLMAERSKLSMWPVIGLMMCAGMVGNLICFIKRLFDAWGQVFGTGSAADILGAAGYYAVFGLIAGMLGVVMGMGLQRFLNRREKLEAQE